MIKDNKIDTVRKEIERNGKTRVYTFCGTLEELTEKFSYTLEIGNSYNKAVKRNPKTIKSLLNCLNRAADIIHACNYTICSYTLVENLN